MQTTILVCDNVVLKMLTTTVRCHFTPIKMTKIITHTQKNRNNKKRQQVVVRMQKNKNFHTLLVGMQTGASTVKNNLAVLQKIKQRVILGPSNFTPRHICEKQKHVPTKIYIQMFIAILFIMAKSRKQPKCPSTDEWVNNMWYIYSMGYYGQ